MYLCSIVCICVCVFLLHVSFSIVFFIFARVFLLFVPFVCFGFYLYVCFPLDCAFILLFCFVLCVCFYRVVCYIVLISVYDCVLV